MDPVHLVKLFRHLGVNFPADLREIEQLPFEQGLAAFNALKERVRKHYRKAVFDLHPDRTGNDPEKTALLKAVTNLRDQLERATLRPAPPPQPPPVVVHFVHPFVSMNFAPTSTTTSTMNHAGPWFVATMRPI